MQLSGVSAVQEAQSGFSSAAGQQVWWHVPVVCTLEAGGTRAQGKLSLHEVFKSSLGYLIPCLKIKLGLESWLSS